MKKNIIFDLDGTICFDGIKIDDKLLQSIISLAQKENVIFASARPIRDMIPVIKYSKELESCNLIGGNGTIVKKDNIIYAENIEKDVVDKLVELTNEYGHKVLLDSKWNYYFNGDTSSNLYKRVDVDNVASNTPYENLEEVIKIVVLYGDEKLEKAFSKYEDYITKCHTNIYETENMFDILPTNVNKFFSLNKYFGLESGEYIAFGNDTNDIELLKNAKHGYIVGDDLELEGCKNISLENMVRILNEI